MNKCQVRQCDTEPEYEVELREHEDGGVVIAQIETCRQHFNGVFQTLHEFKGHLKVTQKVWLRLDPSELDAHLIKSQRAFDGQPI